MKPIDVPPTSPSHYWKIWAEDSTCPLCQGIPWLVMPRQIGTGLPAFYFCTCGYLSEVGVGPIPSIPEE